MCKLTHVACVLRESLRGSVRSSGQGKGTWEMREACPVSHRGVQPWEMVWRAQPPSLFSFPFSLFVSLSGLFSFSSCLSPQSPSFNPLLLQSRSMGPEYLPPHLISRQPLSALLLPGDRVAEVTLGPGALPHESLSLSSYSFSLLKLIHRPFPASHSPLLAAKLLNLRNTSGWKGWGGCRCPRAGGGQWSLMKLEDTFNEWRSREEYRLRGY